MYLPETSKENCNHRLDCYSGSSYGRANGKGVAYVIKGPLPNVTVSLDKMIELF